MVGEELSPALGPDTSLRQIKGGKGGEGKKKERDKLQNVHVACDDKRVRENQGIVLGRYKLPALCQQSRECGTQAKHSCKDSLLSTPLFRT